MKFATYHPPPLEKASHRSAWMAAAGILLLALLWQFLTFNGFPNDHYFHVARARQMLLGDWPVRDFVDPGAPLQYVVSAISRRLFGDIALAELVVVALGVAVGAAATVIGASWLARSTVIAVAVAGLEILASPRSYSYPKLLFYGLAGCVAIAVATQASRARLFAAAGLTALAFLMRHDHGLFIGVACVAAITLSASGLGDAARRLTAYAAGVAVLLAPWAAWVQYYQGLVPYFRMGIAVSRREADISLLRDWPRLQPSLGLNAQNSEAWLFYLFHALPLVCLVAVAWRFLARHVPRRGEHAVVVAVSLLAIEIDTTFLRNPLSTRLPDATVPACLLGAWLLGLAWSTRTRWLTVKVAAAGLTAAVFVATSLAIWVVGDVHDKLDEAGALNDWAHVREHARGLWTVVNRQERDVRKYPSRVSASLVPFFHYLDRCSAPTDRLLVSGPYPDVFVLGRRGFAAGHIAFMQGFYTSEADQALMLSRMQRESVPFVLLVQDEQAAFAGNFPTLMSHITSAYDVMADVPVEGMQGVRIYVERQRPRTGVDASTGWPCFGQTGKTNAS